MLDTMSAHELTHGLQDQHFDLQKYMPSGDKLDDDHQAARRFVAEGAEGSFESFEVFNPGHSCPCLMIGREAPPPERVPFKIL